MERDELCRDGGRPSSTVHGSAAGWRKDSPSLAAWLGFAGLERWHFESRFGAGLVSVLILGPECEGGRRKDLLHSTKHWSWHAAVERPIYGTEETGFGDGFRAGAGREGLSFLPGFLNGAS